MRYALTRLPDRGIACWATVGIAGLAAAVVCFRPMFEIGIGAYIGADLEQRGFDYDRVLTAVTDLRPWSLLMLAAALVLLLTSVTALIWGNRPILVLLACAIALLSLRAVLDVDDRLGWPGSGGVIGYEEPKGGRLLQPAIDELKADARRSPEAGEPGWTLLGWRRRVTARAASTAGGYSCGSRSSSRSSQRSGCSRLLPPLPGRGPNSRQSHVRVLALILLQHPRQDSSEPSAGLNGPHPSRRVRSRIAACAVKTTLDLR